MNGFHHKREKQNGHQHGMTPLCQHYIRACDSLQFKLYLHLSVAAKRFREATLVLTNHWIFFMSYFKNTPAKIRVLQDGREKSQVANDYSVLNNIFDLCNLKFHWSFWIFWWNEGKKLCSNTIHKRLQRDQQYKQHFLHTTYYAWKLSTTNICNTQKFVNKMLPFEITCNSPKFSISNAGLSPVQAWINQPCNLIGIVQISCL